MNKKIEDISRGKTVMINKCTRDALISFPDMKPQYDIEYPTYKPDSVTISRLIPLITEKKVTIVLGTWCGDSKLQVPRFIKLMDVLKVNENDITFICVNGAKKAENGLIDNLNITNVPTFILYEKEEELGRIIESPKTSLENDLLLILEK
ncbi:thioredoxin family protein [Pedobacter frigoris]|uniref:thioredoxin family protein n=1 Tax=Pedobacter frigoris TaxID=2571272 RepID=UPI001CED31B7|nr:thioredoxin family protein [Pedobacter frigoris]